MACPQAAALRFSSARARKGETPVTTQPGDDTAAGKAGRGHLRASHADREQAIGTLKAASVAGMLAKDELDLRVGQVFASRTCADLAALIADLPAGLAVAQPPRAARTQDEIMQRPGWWTAVATALYAGVQVFVFPPWPMNSEGDPPKGIVLLFFLSTLGYLFALLIGVVNMVALRRKKRSGGQPPRRPAPGAGGPASESLPSAGPDSQLPPAGHGHQHSAEAAPSCRSRTLLPGWRPRISMPCAR
jgi:hypothetical protein